MLASIKSLLLTDTGKDTVIVSVGTFINVIAGGLFFILAPRILGPSDYGLFSTVVATGLMVTSIANFGIDTGLLKFAKFPSSDFNRILSLALKSYIFLGILIAILGLIIAQFIANFLNQPQIADILRIAFVANMFILLTNFYVASLQARRQFARALIVNITSNVARLVLLAISVYFFTAGIFLLTIIFFSVTILSTLVGKLLLQFRYEKGTKVDELLNFHKYNIWIAASLIISTIPYDNYFLLKIAGPVQTGLYATPFKILTFAHQFGGNFTRVLASRFSSFDTNRKAASYAFKTIIPTSVFIAALVFLTFLSSPIIRIIFGTNFEGSVIVFRILAIGFIFFFASTIPSSIILYYLGKSKISFVITVFRYLTFIILLFAFVTDLKAVGAAIAFTLSESLSFILMLVYAVYKLEVFSFPKNR